MSTPSPDAGTTADGIPITEGLAVFTNELRVGVIRLDRITSDGWFDVEYSADEHGHTSRVMQNGERVATRFEGRAAVDSL